MDRPSILNDHATLIARLFRAARAERWSLDPAEFADALARSATARFRDERARARDVASYIESLHIEDLALACACARGHETAWEHFVSEYRAKLRAAGRAIAGEQEGAELADSLYADLYGVTSGDQSRSLFDYFHGRSTLATWLRAVMAQRHVDAKRASRRLEPLPEHLPESARSAAADPPDPDRDRYVRLLETALSAAVAALEPRERLRLSCYYAQELTLAAVGRLMGEHEATVSRRLDRTRRALRAAVQRRLREEARLTDPQIRLCYEYALEEWPFDLTAKLSKSEP